MLASDAHRELQIEIMCIGGSWHGEKIKLNPKSGGIQLPKKITASAYDHEPWLCDVHKIFDMECYIIVKYSWPGKNNINTLFFLKNSEISEQEFIDKVKEEIMNNLKVPKGMSLKPDFFSNDRFNLCRGD